jgi:nicotinamidase-related amidase
MTNPVLLLIDVQRNMLEPPTPAPDADRVGPAIAEVLRQARDSGATVIHVRNNGSEDDPDAPGSVGWELVHAPRDGEPVVDKTQPDSFAGTDLATRVPAEAPIVVVGLQSNYCVRATSLAAIQRGHSVTLVSGAHATYDEDQPAADISKDVEDELQAAGVAIVTAGDDLFG